MYYAETGVFICSTFAEYASWEKYSQKVSEIPNVNSAMQMNNIQNSGYSLNADSVLDKKKIQKLSHNTATTPPHSNKLPLLHIHSCSYFLGHANKHPYQCTIQRDLVQLKCVMYPMSGYIVYWVVLTETKTTGGVDHGD
jgi:hypothetical protein